MISLAVAPISLRNLLARRLHGLLRLPSKGVVAAGRVAELAGEVRHHRFQHPRIQRAGGVIIHINRQVYARGHFNLAGNCTHLGLHLLFVLAPRLIDLWDGGGNFAYNVNATNPCASPCPPRGLFMLRQILNADALQHSGNGVVHPRQRLLDGAARGQIAALRALGAGGNEKRPVDGQNHLVGRNLARISGQRIAAVHAGMRAQQPGFGQLLQNLGQQLRRNPVGVGHILGAQRSRLRVLGQVLERHQPVIGFFGQLEHEYPTSSVRIQYTTISVGISSPSSKLRAAGRKNPRRD